MTNVEKRLREFLVEIPILPRRMRLETPGVQATVPLLRGVWGAALHAMDAEAYRAVFDVEGGPGADATGYILRPAPPDPQTAPALDYLLIGKATQYDAALWRAWDIASGMGLGKQRRPFHIREVWPLSPQGSQQPIGGLLTPWRLHEATWPFPAAAPCRLIFPAPLRLLRHKRLIEEPTPADLAVAAWRRVASYLPETLHAAWRELQPEILSAAREIPYRPWCGDRLDLARYSGRQKKELTLHGVRGFLEFPQGPGPLHPLLAAARWLHFGKGTAVGLGELAIEPRT